MANKPDAHEPSGPPPPTYSQHDTNSTMGTPPAPQAAYLQPQHTAAGGSDYYGASPNMAQHQQQPYGYPPQGSYAPQGYGPQGGYPPQGNGYYAPGPGYGGGYGGQPQGMYYGQPQGGYYQQQNRGGGFGEALLASLACCCCLDCLLF